MSSADALLSAIIGRNGTSAAAGPEPVCAFAWARVSTDMQGDRGQSIPEQLRQIRAYAEQFGIEIVEEFTEVGSAFQRDVKRVAFYGMVERAKRDRSWTTIALTWGVDRARASIRWNSTRFSSCWKALAISWN